MSGKDLSLTFGPNRPHRAEIDNKSGGLFLLQTGRQQAGLVVVVVCGAGNGAAVHAAPWSVVLATREKRQTLTLDVRRTDCVQNKYPPSWASKRVRARWLMQQTSQSVVRALDVSWGATESNICRHVDAMPSFVCTVHHSLCEQCTKVL